MSICDSPPISVIGLLSTFRYIFYVELYSGVVLFSLIFRVRVRLGLGSVIGLGLGFKVKVRIRDR